MPDVLRASTVDRLTAGASGDRIAVMSAHGTLSRAGFDAAVNHMAHELRRRNVRADECVAIIVPRSLELITGIHGILRAGAAYVPIDPEHPPARIRIVLQECGARMVVATNDFAALADELGVERIDPGIAAAGPVEPLAAPGDLAYVIYTSGSTGRPKGVMVEHRSVANRLRWMQRRYRLGADDVVLHKTPATFDVSVWELMWWPLAGASVALLEPGAQRDPRRIAAAIHRYGVTVIHFVPSMLGPFLDHVEDDADSIRQLASLRLVFCSGEALTPRLVERFNRLLGATIAPQLVNLYGPTEATVDVTYFDCPSAGRVETVPIGKPIDNTAVYVLDEHANACPVGVAGELNIAGVALARGYRGRDDLTSAVFVPDERVPGGRRYRTGDLCRWRGDGNLEFLGRTDDEVKIRGNRVHLGEVQLAMESCPGVRSVAVAAESTDTHGTCLVGYFAGGCADRLRAHVAEQLPGYMVPTRFVELTELPLTASGKLDRRALPEQPGTERLSAGSGVGGGRVGVVLAEVFGSVLGVGSVGVDEDFFTIGGDSILALAVRTEAEKRGVVFDIEELFARPTVAGLAEVAVLAGSGSGAVGSAGGVGAAFALVPLIDRAALHDAQDAFPASVLQLGMLFHSIERAESTMYKDVFRYRVAMPWRGEEFAAAFDRLVARHPALRSSFELGRYSVPLQVVWPQVPRALDVVRGADDTMVGDHIAAWHSHPYVFDRAPLYGLCAFVGAEGVDLVFAFHHAILDGWSVANLIRELLQDYLFCIGVEVAPVDTEVHPATMLAEFVRLENEARDSVAARDFWGAVLEGSRPTVLESLVAHVAPVPADPVVTVQIPQWLHDGARRLAVSRGLPLKSVLLAAHCLALRRICGAADVTTGLVTHGRPGRVGAETAAGMFLNTIPIRLDDTAVSWLQAAEHLARFERASHPHRRYPLHIMQTDAGHPLFNTAFNFINYRPLVDLARIPGIEMLDFDVHEQTNFALVATVGVEPRTGGLFLRVTGDQAGGADEYVSTFMHALTALADTPLQAIDLGVVEPAAHAVPQQVDERESADRSVGVGGGRVGVVLAEVFGSVLGVGSVGVDEDFFTIGGDSILALVARSRAEKRGVVFDIEELFARPTVAGLAEVAVLAGSGSGAVGSAGGVGAAFALVPLIDRAALHDAQDAFPASVLQLGMLFHSIERAESTMYKDVFRYRVAMPWRGEEFAAAFDRLVARHPALRSSFELGRYSVPLQVVWPQVPRALDVVRGADDTMVGDHIAAWHSHPYVFDRAPLYGLCAFVGAEGVDLVFAFHHAILDGWSVANLIRELLQDYLFCIGVEVAPVDTEVHPATMLAEFVRLENEARDSVAARDFWGAVLEGSRPTVLESLVAHVAPVPADPVVTVQIPQWLHDGARRLAVSRGLPLKSVLLAAHCLALRRICGAADVTTGLVTHGRPGRVGAETAAGMFLNTIPIRLDDTAVSWLQAAEHLARFERASHPHRRYPLHIMQTDAGHPLFNTAFDYVSYHVLTGTPDGTAETGNAGLRLLEFDVHERTNFALWVTAAADPRNGRLSLRVGGDAAALTADQAREFATSFVRILAMIVRAPDAAIDIAGAALTARDVTQLIAERAAASPAAVALIGDTARWTYAELDCGADRIAAGLLTAGMPPGARVGVRLDRSPEQIVAVLGVLKAGGAVVPIDPGYPDARIRAMTDLARPFRVLDDIAEVRAMLDVPATVTLPAIEPDHVAYVLFTSGSTGEPKGVAMPHRALHNIVAWQNRRPSGVVGGLTLQFFPLSFDVAFQEVFSTLCGGGALRLVSDSQRRDLPGLARLVSSEGIERIFLTCTALQAFAEAAHLTGVPPAALRAVVNVGEQLRVTPEIRRLCATNPGLILENQYGPTETHEATSYTLSGPPELFPTLPPIGTPIDGVTVEVLGPDGRPVPTGTRGEIHIGGVGLAIGYEGRPDLTAERFRTVGERGERMYRTGDLGLRMPGGDLVHLGRVDTQVKVRGYRIECAEVELALMNLGDKGIRAAAVVAGDQGSADAILVAYLVGDPRTVDLDGIRHRLRAVLPAYLIPARFRWIDEFPLTPSGKRDDKALRELPMAPETVPSVTRTECTGDESAVADIMSEFAGGAEFTADTDFFDAGGTSIGAMRVVMAITRKWDVEIPLDSFAATPTPRHIARLVAAGGPQRPFDPIVALRDSGDRPPLFLVHPMGGNVLCYLDLVKHLPDGQPVFALQAAGAAPGATPLHTMSDLAASYIAAIRRVRPSGPYHVGGWSFGGYVAVEIARQLADDELASLILLDTTALDAGPHPVVAESELITWFFGELLLEAHGANAIQLAAASGVDAAPGSFDSALRYAIEAGIVPPECSPQLIRRLYGIFRANFEATVTYRHEPLDRDLTLLRSAEGLPADLAGAHRIVGSMFDSPTNGWDRLNPRSLTVVEVAGDHLSMMSEPHVADVAAKLSSELMAVPIGGVRR